jgi:hypothetical protein
MESATEKKQPKHHGKHGAWVTVKLCGKSARLCIAICIRGKPYWKQDKISMCR